MAGNRGKGTKNHRKRILGFYIRKRPDDGNITMQGEPGQESHGIRKPKGGRVLTAALVICLVGLVVYGVLTWRFPAGTSQAGTGASTADTAGVLQLNNKPGAKNSMLPTEDVAGKISPSVVGVLQYRKGSVTPAGEGSGIVMTQDGYIITNYHVIADADRVAVVTSDKKEFEAQVVGSDCRTDIAVIKVENAGMAAAAFGNSDQCRVGEQVVAIGNPSGLQLAGSVTQGIISALNRNVDVGNGPMNLIQTDAAINPGNSGGALCNMYGQIVGINSAKISQNGYEGIGFSIPINTAKPIIDSIMKYGYVKDRVRLGLSCREISASAAKADNLPQGVRIEYVEPGGSADKSGIKAGDILVALNNVKVTSAETLIVERDKHKPGDVLPLEYYRPTTKQQVTVSITLVEDKGDAKTTSAAAKAGW